MNALLPPIKASFEHDGQPVAGGFVYFYEPGTTTPKTTWSDALGSVPNANPVQLDSQGRATIFINGFYKVTVTSALGTVLYTVDNVSASPYQTLAVSEWITSGVTPTYLSATSFSVPGDYTGTFEVGRRIRTVDAGGTDYGWVKTASFGAGVTTVTVILDAGSLDAGLASVDVGIASVKNRSLPTDPVVTKTDDYVLTVADVGKQFIFNKGTAVAATILAATAVPSGSRNRFRNAGAGLLTVTGTVLLYGTSTVNPTVPQYADLEIWSDGTSWRGMLVSAIPAANTVVVTNAGGTLNHTAALATTASLLALTGEASGNLAGGTATTSPGASMGTFDMGTVNSGEEYIIQISALVAKGGTAGWSSITLGKSSGTASINFTNGNTAAANGTYVPISITWWNDFLVIMKIISTGTLVMNLQAISEGSNSTVATPKYQYFRIK